ncbi:hypothetical protein IW261DRAFT_1509294 [Armillaria novae-zelandiae]|uniref:Uncharacterized protein n=1 Tax=Armillaria novae-zelandiae TaxID=153914 RepID=A0AA39U768_9AGAR|nr:hypothetical protein IW261DRAFT_1509294 [Armillaria novae-zelandiae]
MTSRYIVLPGPYMPDPTSYLLAIALSCLLSAIFSLRPHEYLAHEKSELALLSCSDVVFVPSSFILKSFLLLFPPTTFLTPAFIPNHRRYLVLGLYTSSSMIGFTLTEVLALHCTLPCSVCVTNTTREY